MKNYDRAFQFVIGDEGGFVNNPHDSGGPTKYGISMKNFASFVGREATLEDIQNMTLETAKSIYWLQFWKPLGCEHIQHPGVATAIFDSAVLYGVQTAAILAQKAISQCGGNLKFDGVLGEKSIELLNIAKPEEFLKAFHGQLLQRIDAIIAVFAKNEDFRRGWTSRADRLLNLV